MMKRHSESGNIFFMLFGAVALVGVVAASTSTLMRGPLSTVVNVNARAKADTQMQIAAKLAMVRASQQALSGDCDADGNVEPIPALDASPKPAGGGQLPASIGASQKDPWGNAYGYCVWDIGTKNADGACAAAAGEVTRLKGDYNNNYPVMVIVSSGPDRVFQTQCNDWTTTSPGSDPNVNNYPTNFVGSLTGQHATAVSGDVIFKPNASDDIVISYTYDQASQVAGGLWSLTKTDPNKITTNKDLDIQTNANFASGKEAKFQGAANFDTGSKLDLGFDRSLADTAGLFKLPNQTALSSCNLANDGALRLNISGTHNALQICDGRAGPPSWVDPSASGMSVTKIDDLSDAVASFSSQSKNIVLGDGSGLNFTSTSAGHNNVLLGIGSAAALSAAGADNVILGSNTATSLTTGSHNIILGSNINVAASTSNSLNIGNLIYGTGMTGTGTTSAGNVGIGTDTPNVKLEVAGSVQATQFQFNSSNALAMSGGDITLSYGGASQLFVNGNGLGVGISPTHKLDVDGDAYGQRFISTFSSASTLPGFTFGGDVNTGIAHPSGSTIGFTLGGSEKARLTSTGLGIGVSSPSVALDVVGAGAFSSYVSAVTSFNFGSANGMYNQAGNISFNTGGSPRVYVTSGGLGVGLATPMVSIDAAGAIRPGMMVTCDGTTHGAIRYGSGDVLEYCSTDNAWYSLVASGGGGGGANLWTNNTSYISRANAHFINSSQTLPVTLSSAGTRFFWYPDKAAFRAGGTSGAQWSDANIGIYSAALGYDSLASGPYSFATGNSVTASGDYSFGAGRTIDASGNNSVALGQNLTTSGTNSVALGYFGVASGASSIMLGQTADATGANSMALGLGVAAGARPIVSGARSFGIFMGDQSGRNITSNNTMELLGGKFLIDANPLFASSSVIGGTLSMDVNGNVGAEQYCDSDGSYCFTAQSISSGAVGVFENASNVIRLTSGTVNYSSASYVFGSPQLSDDGVASHRTRLYFDKNSGSFRTGGASGTQWDSVGAYSTGIGYDTVATGNYSVAVGQKVSATSTNSVAFGLGSAAGAAPIVSGARSYGVFMGDQSGVNFASSNTFGIFGGRMVIDPKNPATQLAARGVLDLGAATDAMVMPAGTTAERPGAGASVNGMIRYNNDNGKFEAYQGGLWLDILTSGGGAVTAAGANGQVQYNSGGYLGASANYTWNGTTLGVIGIGSFSTAVRAGDGLVGTPGFAFSSETNTGFYRVGTSAIGVTTNGVLRMTVQDPSTTNASVVFNGNDAIALPAGVTGQRPSVGVNGMLRYNSTNGKFEGYQGGSWQDILTGSAIASAPDRGIQFNSGNTFAAVSTFTYTSAGRLGIGTASPVTMVDVAGTLKLSDGGESCSITYKGAIRYTSVNTLQYCNGTGWTSTAAGSGVMAIDDLTDAITRYTSGSMYLGSGVGVSATGISNTAIGSNTMANITSAADGTAVGYAALNSLTTGQYNTAVGSIAASNITIGQFNTALGYSALNMATSAVYNTALGYRALRANTADSNVAVGFMTLDANTSGIGNTAVGTSALAASISGGSNVALGFGAGSTTTTGTGNILIGAGAVAPAAGTSYWLNVGGAITGDMLTGNLAINGTGALTLPVGATGTRPGAPVNGMLRYNSASGKFEGYQAGAWQDILTGAIAGGAAAPDRGIQFNSGNSFYASSNLLYTSSGDLLVSGTYTGTPVPPATGAGSRMFFDPASGAFRAGQVTGTAWDAANLGVSSFAAGNDVKASGGGSAAFGQGTSATAPYSTAFGYNTTAGGTGAIAMGNSNLASATSAIALGWNTVANGVASTTIGKNIEADGDYSMAIGLGNPALVSKVTGTNSLGIFMNDSASNVTFASSNTMGIFGGKVVIDPTALPTYLYARTALDVNGSIKVSDGGETCSTTVKGAIRYTSVNTLQYCNGTSWTSTASSGTNVLAIDDLSDAITQYASGGSMYLGSGVGVNGTAGNNTALGTNALSTVVNSSGNTAVGVEAMRYTNNTASVVTGGNSGFGYQALRGNTSPSANTGTNNTGLGYQTLMYNTSGSSNTAVGGNALYGNSSGGNNTATGQSALFINNSGNNNTATGSAAMYTNSTGSGNTATGTQALLSNLSGNYNTATGAGALYYNSGKHESTAIGYNAMYYADSASTSAITYNTALGAYALRGSTTASNNIGTANTAIGHSSLIGITSGSNNVALGYNAGNTTTTGASNILIGSGAVATTATTSNWLNIGNTITGDMATGNLAINGTGALTLPVGVIGTRPGTPVNGMLRYNSASGKFEGYQAGSWQDILTTGVSGGAAAPDRGIQFNSGNNFAASSNLVYSSLGAFLVTGTYNGVPFMPTSGVGSRMIFDPNSGAFRAGAVTGTKWDNANVGNFSAGFGLDTQVKGNYSVGMGQGNTVDGDASVGLGFNNSVTANSGIALGASGTVSGTNGIAIGGGNTASGLNSIAMGNVTTASGVDAIAIGTKLTVGNGTAGSGLGDFSLGWGLGNAAGAAPSITGVSSLGIFMGDQSALVMASSNTMGLYGGRFVIDPAVPSTYTYARTALDVNGSIKVGDGGETCATTVKGAIRYTSVNTLQYCNGTSWTSTASGTGLVAVDDLTDAITNYTGSASASTNSIQSMFIGSGSGVLANTSAGYNTAIGVGSLVALTGGTANTAVGYRTLYALNTGTNNTAMGYTALRNNDTGSYNTAYGYGVLANNTSGINNTGVGTGSLAANTTGGGNTSTGYGALASNVAKQESTAMGYNAMYYSDNTATTGFSYNTAIGAYALRGSVAAGSNTGTSNTAVGHNVFRNITSGSGNVGVGSGAGLSLTTGSNNILFGSAATTPLATTSNWLSIGNVITGDMATGTYTLVGTGALALQVGDNSTRPGTPVNGMLRYNSSSNKFEGYQGGTWQDILTSAGVGTMIDDLGDAETDYATDHNMFFGSASGAGILAGGQYNLAVGESAGAALTTGDRNLGIGYNAIKVMTTAVDNTGVGYTALAASTGSFNTAMGSKALAVSTTGGSNSAFGLSALGSNTTGGNNVAVGTNSLLNNVAKSESTAVGLDAMRYADNSATPAISYNTALGAYALRGSVAPGTNTGTLNTAIGHSALMLATSGSNNTAIGYFAGNGITTGTGNTIVGVNSGYTITTGSGNLLFGSGILTPAAGTSNYLSIGNVIFASGGFGAGTTVGTGFVGIRTSTPRVSLDVVGTDALMVPSGNNSTDRPTGSNLANGMIRYNATDVRFEGYQNGSWLPFSSGGAASVLALDDLTDVATNYTGSASASTNSTQSMFFGTGAGSSAAVGASRNIALGYYTSNALTTAVDNIAIGYAAGQFVSTGPSNIAIGTNALTGVTGNKLTGGYNVAIGQMALSSAQGVAAYNVAIGQNAMANNTIGDSNTAVGQNTLVTNVSGQDSTALGQYAMANANSAGGAVFRTYNTAVGNAALAGSPTPANNTGKWNTAVGHSSMIGNTSGDQNTALGALVMGNNTTGSWNTAVGVQASVVNSTGNNNVSVGVNSLYSNAAKSESTALGYSAMQFADNTSTGSVTYNTGVGAYALRGSGTASNNTGKFDTALGHSAMSSITSGGNNTAIGAVAGGSLTTGSNNLLVGSGAGSTLTTGSGNLMFGSGVNTPAVNTSNFMSIGNLIFASGGFGVDTAVGTGFVGIRTATPRVSLDVVGTDALMIPAGNNTTNRPTGSNLANGMMRYNTTDARFEGYQNGSWLPFSSAAAGAAVTAAGTNTQVQFNSNGVLAATSNFTWTDSTGMLSVSSGYQLSSSTVFTYPKAASDNSGLAIGVNALASQTSNTGYNIGIGNSAGQNINSSLKNALIGYMAGQYITTSPENVAVGYLALQGVNGTPMAGGGFNTAIGSGALSSLQGVAANNTGIGEYAGLNISTGLDNTAIGGEAMQGVSGTKLTGSENTSLGYAAGWKIQGAANYNTYLGSNSAKNATTGSSNVIIGYNTANALTTGSSNLVIGYSVNVPSATASNFMTIGNLIFSSGGMGTGTTVGTGNIGIRTADPRVTLDIIGTDAIMIPAGNNTTNRPTGSNLANGMIRYNTTDTRFEGYQNGAWLPFSSGGAPTTLALDGLTDAKTDYVTDNNLLIGTPADAYAIASGGKYNLTLGQLAGDSITTGDNNIAIGYNALTAVTTSSYNLAIGKDVLTATTSGTNNVALGDSALVANTVGYANVAIGRNNMSTNVGGSEATAVGYNAMLYANSVAGATATFNTALGAYALQGSSTASANTGTNNTAIGHSALAADTAGYKNTAVGNNALAANTSGQFNTALGQGALSTNVAGVDNTAVGVTALQYVSGDGNVAVGVNAIQSIVGVPLTGTENTAIGKTALQNIQGATNYNVAVGSSAGSNITTGSSNIMIGYDVDAQSITGSGQLSIGNVIFASGGFGTGTSVGNGKVGIRTALPRVALDITGTDAIMIPAGNNTTNRPTGGNLANGMMRYNTTDSRFEGYQNGSWLPFSSGGGASSLAIDDLTDSIVNYTSGNMYLGTGVGATTVAGNQNTAMGVGSMAAVTSGTQSLAIGYGALASMTTATENTVVGRSAGLSTTNGSFNVVLGDQALQYGTSSYYNVAIGSQALSAGWPGSNPAVARNISIGATTMYAPTSAVDNQAMGDSALNSITSGFRNLGIGTNSLAALTTGNSNIALGYGAGVAVLGGSSNILIGGSAGANLTTGSGNLLFGSAINAPAVGTSNYMSIGNLIFASGGFGTGTSVGAGIIGIRTASPRVTLDITGTDAIMIPAGNNSTNRPTGGNLANGMMRYNTTDTRFEGYQNGSWLPFSSATAGSVTAAGSNLQLQFNNGGVLGASSNMTFTSSTNTLAVTGIVSVTDRVNIAGTSGLTAPTGIALSNLSDVSLGALASGKVLTYNGTAWAATTPAGGVAGSTTQIQYNNAGALAGSANFTWNNASSLLNVTGDISYSGVLTDTSDRRLKTDIAPLSDKGSMLEKLGQLGTYSYHLKRDMNTTQYGVIAQEIKEVFPELVRTDEKSPEKYLSVNYTGLIAPLIEASKELKAENDNLKTQVAKMKSERDDIQASLQDLQKDVKGLKVRTGYGIDKAGMDGWMLLLIGVIFGGGSVMFFFGGMVRAQRNGRE